MFSFFCCWFCYHKKLYFFLWEHVITRSHTSFVCLAHSLVLLGTLLCYCALLYMYVLGSIPSISVSFNTCSNPLYCLLFCIARYFVCCCYRYRHRRCCRWLCFIAHHTVCFCFQLFPSAKVTAGWTVTSFGIGVVAAVSKQHTAQSPTKQPTRQLNNRQLSFVESFPGVLYILRCSILELVSAHSCLVS